SRARYSRHVLTRRESVSEIVVSGDPSSLDGNPASRPAGSARRGGRRRLRTRVGRRVWRRMVRRRALGGPAATGRGLDIEEGAGALERPDPARLARLRAELAAYPRDPHPQVLEIVAVLRAPDLGQQLGVEDDLARVRGQVLEQQPLGPRELDELAAATNHPP